MASTTKGGPRITFFTAPWCEPCKKIERLMMHTLGSDEFQQCVDKVCVKDPSSAPQIKRYNVTSVPFAVFHIGPSSDDDILVRNASNAAALQRNLQVWSEARTRALPMLAAAVVSSSKY